MKHVWNFFRLTPPCSFRFFFFSKQKNKKNKKMNFFSAYPPPPPPFFIFFLQKKNEMIFFFGRTPPLYSVGHSFSPERMHRFLAIDIFTKAEHWASSRVRSTSPQEVQPLTDSQVGVWAVCIAGDDVVITLRGGHKCPCPWGWHCYSLMSGFTGTLNYCPKEMGC